METKGRPSRGVKLSFAMPEESEIQNIARRLDEAAAGTNDYHKFLKNCDFNNDELAGTLGMARVAFEYEPRSNPSGTDTYFGPFAVLADGTSLPPPILEIQHTVIELWEQLTKYATEPLPLARLHDLCLCRNHGNFRQHAEQAGEAYLKLADFSENASSPSEALQLCAFLRRVRWLGKSAKIANLERQGESALKAKISSELATEPINVGRCIVFAKQATEENLAFSEIDDLIERILDSSPNSNHKFCALDLKLTRANGGNRVDNQKEIVMEMLQDVDAGPANHRSGKLQRALKLATDFGLSELRNEITKKLQNQSLVDQRLAVSSFHTTLDPGMAEETIRHIVEQEFFGTSLLELIAGPPPSGDSVTNRKFSESMRVQAPLAFEIDRENLRADGLPRFRVQSEDEKLEYCLTQVEIAQISCRAGLIAEALTQIGARWSSIAVEELSSFLSESNTATEEAIRMIANAFTYYFAGDYVAAAYVAMPQVERLAREIVLQHNKPAYHLQRQRTPGQYPGLAVLMKFLSDEKFDDSWLRFIQTMFFGPMGINLRNEMLHGFVGLPDAAMAAMTLLTCLYLLRGSMFPNP